MFSKVFRKSCRLWINVEKQIVDPGRPYMTIWHIRIVRWDTKTTNTYSSFFLLLQWLHECASQLYVHCLYCCLLVQPIHLRQTKTCNLWRPFNMLYVQPTCARAPQAFMCLCTVEPEFLNSFYLKSRILNGSHKEDYHVILRWT